MALPVCAALIDDPRDAELTEVRIMLSRVWLFDQELIYDPRERHIYRVLQHLASATDDDMSKSCPWRAFSNPFLLPCPYVLQPS